MIEGRYVDSGGGREEDQRREDEKDVERMVVGLRGDEERKLR